MNWRSLVRIALQSVLRNKLRTFLTTLGIAIGVSTVIMLVAIGYGAQKDIARNYQGIGTNVISVWPGSAKTGGVNKGSGTLNRLTVRDAELLKRGSTLLAAVSPVVMTYTQAISRDSNVRTRVNGVNVDYRSIRSLALIAGVWFTDEDIGSVRKLAVLGSGVSRNLFPRDDAVGQQINLRNVPFTIIGVLASKGQTQGEDMDDVILVPHTTAQARLAGGQAIGRIAASTAAPEHMVAAQAEMRMILRDAHRLGPLSEDDFVIENQIDLASAAQSSTKTMTLLLGAVGCVSLLVGGIGIMNIMLVSVTERTREIGIRIAIGARSSDVLLIFLTESVAICALGGVAGLVLGWVGAFMLVKLAGMTVVTPFILVLVAIGFSTAIGIIFGLFPARRAAALDPIEALRHS